MKSDFGGIFVVLNTIICVLFTIGNWFFNCGLTIGQCFGIWIFILCSITIYAFIKIAVLNNDFSLIAGYSSKKEYNENELAKMLKSITKSDSFFALLYTSLYAIILFLPHNIKSLYGGIITSAYIINLFILIIHTNNKYKYKINK